MKYIKKNLLLIIPLIILVSYFILAFCSNDKEIKRFNNDNLESRLKCQNDSEYQKNFDYYCSSLTDEYHETDFIYNYYNLSSNYLCKIIYLMPLVLLLPALYNVSNYYKNNKETDNKKLKIKLYKEAYKPILVYLLCFIFIVLATILESKGIKSTYSITNITSSVAVSLWGNYYIYHPLVFIIVYLLTILIHFILYVNIGLLIIQKKHNYFNSLVLSCIVLLLIEVILEFGISPIICKYILNHDYSEMFNIFNYIFFDSHNSILGPIIIPFFLTILSYLSLNKYSK